jgi:hypothetical protein
VLRSRWTAWRNPGSVTRPSTTMAARITIVVLSPLDKAYPIFSFSQAMNPRPKSKALPLIELPVRRSP